jgi:hypothetical protein
MIVEAQGCPGLVTETGERRTVGQGPWCNKASILGKGLGGKALGIKFCFAGGTGIITWGYPEGGLIFQKRFSPMSRRTPLGAVQTLPRLY